MNKKNETSFYVTSIIMGVPFSPNHQTLLGEKRTPIFYRFKKNDVSSLKKMRKMKKLKFF